MTQNELRGSTTKLSKIEVTVRWKRTDAFRSCEMLLNDRLTAARRPRLGPQEEPINQVESRILLACNDLSTGRQSGANILVCQWQVGIPVPRFGLCKRSQEARFRPSPRLTV